MQNNYKVFTDLDLLKNNIINVTEIQGSEYRQDDSLTIKRSNTSNSLVKLSPDKVEIDAGNIQIGTDTLTEMVALASKNSNIDLTNTLAISATNKLAVISPDFSITSEKVEDTNNKIVSESTLRSTTINATKVNIVPTDDHSQVQVNFTDTDNGEFNVDLNKLDVKADTTTVNINTLTPNIEVKLDSYIKNLISNIIDSDINLTRADISALESIIITAPGDFELKAATEDSASTSTLKINEITASNHATFKNIVALDSDDMNKVAVTKKLYVESPNLVLARSNESGENTEILNINAENISLANIDSLEIVKNLKAVESSTSTFYINNVSLISANSSDESKLVLKTSESDETEVKVDIDTIETIASKHKVTTAEEYKETHNGSVNKTYGDSNSSATTTITHNSPLISNYNNTASSNFNAATTEIYNGDYKKSINSSNVEITASSSTADTEKLSLKYVPATDSSSASSTVEATTFKATTEMSINGFAIRYDSTSKTLIFGA